MSNSPLSSAVEEIQAQFLASPQGKRCGAQFKQTPEPSHQVLWRVLDEADEKLVTLNFERSYRAEDLCSDLRQEHAYWPPSSRAGFNRAIGLCLSFLVRIDALPLECVNPEVNGTKRYRLTRRDDT